ncbi:Uncharacterized protein Fot_05793 [Forsythia ovata]|uniref:Uncharacterized protein n=1 Tax=Forsythia ovata TaxID=205694 RepID=A0ABD1WR79_9LAMI
MGTYSPKADSANEYSVAWYPIYRIPDGTLCASFLTYHSLGHLVRRNPIYDSSVDTCIVSPVVGLQSYIAQILKKIYDHPLLLTKRAAEDVLEWMDSLAGQEDRGVAKKLAMHIADVAEIWWANFWIQISKRVVELQSFS